MFVRTHRVGSNVYSEALESYRDQATGKPRHRSVARWSAERSLAEEIAEAEWETGYLNRQLASCCAVIDGTVSPRDWRQYYRARKAEPDLQARLDKASKRLAALNKAKDGLGIADDEVERARQAIVDEVERRREQAASKSPAASARLFVVRLSERLRDLSMQNDPEAMRAGLQAIAAELLALAQR
jgi:hypothetical protein